MNNQIYNKKCKVIPGINDFETVFPDLAKQWHPTMNGTLKPSEIAARSNKKYYWLCEKGHPYDAAADKRALGQGCPYCANRRLLVGFNDLKTRCPEAAEDWDYTLNKGNPENYKYCSSKIVHWVCSKCGNNWESRIRDRVKAEFGCKQCAVKARAQKKIKTHASRTGGIQDPVLLAEWDKDRNDKSPSEYSPKSNKYAYWICSKCDYHYRAKICNRANGRNCPFCSNRVVVPGVNDLATTHPQLAKEWHPTKNLPLTPEQVTYGIGKKVWWICPEKHEYQATILHRASGGTNCPICNSGRQTSFAEQAVFFYVNKAFPDAISRYSEIFEKGMELDIYIPSINLGIEYDGEAWHRDDKIAREIKKCEICHEHGIRLIRLKENLLEIPDSEKYRHTADSFLSIKGNMYEHDKLALVIRQLLDEIEPRTNFWTRKNPLMLHSPVDIDIKRDELEIRGYMTNIKSGSFGALFPQLAKEWHPKKNGEITPYKVKPHTNFKAWWICPQCGNEYYASVDKRTYGCGCPKCGQLKSRQSRMKRVQMINRETKEILCTFDSITDASRQMKISSGNISAVLHGQRSNAGGYFWQLETKE